MQEGRSPVGDREVTWNLATSGSCYTSRAGGLTGVPKAQDPEPSGANVTAVGAAEQILTPQREGLSSEKWRHQRDPAHVERGGDTP